MLARYAARAIGLSHDDPAEPGQAPPAADLRPSGSDLPGGGVLQPVYVVEDEPA